MAKFADVTYKTVTAGLGLATLWVGGNLVFNITRGISWHYAQDKVLLSALLSTFLLRGVSCSLHSKVCLPSLILVFYVNFSNCQSSLSLTKKTSAVRLSTGMLNFVWVTFVRGKKPTLSNLCDVRGQPTGEGEAQGKNWTRTEDDMIRL